MHQEENPNKHINDSIRNSRTIEIKLKSNNPSDDWQGVPKNLYKILLFITELLEKS